MIQETHRIKLDTKSVIFQNLNGASHEISIFHINDHDLNIYNNVTEQIPAVVHGNGASKQVLNRLGNYIGRAYSNKDACITCNEDKIKLDTANVKN